MNIELQPVATVRSDYRRDGPRLRRREIVAELVFPEALNDALLGIEEWSHLFVLFWMPSAKPWPGTLRTHPRHRADLPEVGVFAARGRERPNPIGLAVVEMLGRAGNVLTVRGLDAFDGSDVLDIKPYDQYDVVASPMAPPWWQRVASPPPG